MENPLLNWFLAFLQVRNDIGKKKKLAKRKTMGALAFFYA